MRIRSFVLIKSKTCKYDGCSNPVWSKGFCQWHTPKKSATKKQQPLKRSPLKKISDKRKKQQAVYSVLRKQFLKDNPKCAVFPHLEATQVHHKNHREGERLNDTRYWLAVSDEGHKYIHANPQESYERNWLIKG